LDLTQGRGEGSGQSTGGTGRVQDQLLPGISETSNYILRMRSYSFSSQAAAIPFTSLSSLLSPAPSHGQAPSWLKTNLDGVGGQTEQG